MAVVLLPEGFEDLESGLGVAGLLHVDPHEEPLAAVEDPAKVVDGARAVDVESELRKLQREVPSDAGLLDRVDDLEVLAGGGIGVGQTGDALAEEIEGVQEAAALDGARRVDCFGHRLAGDEPAREAGRPPHAVARRDGFQETAGREEMKKSLGGMIEHPDRLMRATGRDEQVLDRPRVVPEHGAVAYAEPAALENDDPARLERFGGFLDGLAAAGHLEVGALDGELLDELIDAALE